jgi:Ni,Fe-hydrogenase maturation factor
VKEIAAASIQPGLVTHHLGASELLCVAEEFYSGRPRQARLLTIGAGSIDVGEQLSREMEAALPDARDLLEQTVRQLMR